MYGIILALIVSFLKAGSELLGKILTSPERKQSLDEYTLAYGGRLMGAFIVLPLILFIPFSSVSLSYFLILMASSLFNAISTVTALKAVKYGDLSLVGPLSAFTIPFLFITGFLIAGELPNTYGLFGIMFIFIGSYFLQIHELKNGFLGPILAVYNDIGARYMIVTAMIWSITTPLDKIGIVEYGVFQWMFMLNVSIALIMSLYTFGFYKKSFYDLHNIKALKKISLLTIVGGGMLLLQMFALKLTLAIYVISIKRASGIFSIILGAVFFKEKNIPSKLLAAVIMLIGVGIITLFGNI